MLSRSDTERDVVLAAWTLKPCLRDLKLAERTWSKTFGLVLRLHRFSCDRLNLLLECRRNLLSILWANKDACPIESCLLQVGLGALSYTRSENVYIVLRELRNVGCYSNQHPSCSKVIIHLD